MRRAMLEPPLPSTDFEIGHSQCMRRADCRTPAVVAIRETAYLRGSPKLAKQPHESPESEEIFRGGNRIARLLFTPADLGPTVVRAVAALIDYQTSHVSGWNCGRGSGYTSPPHPCRVRAKRPARSLSAPFSRAPTLANMTTAQYPILQSNACDLGGRCSYTTSILSRRSTSATRLACRTSETGITASEWPPLLPTLRRNDFPTPNFRKRFSRCLSHAPFETLTPRMMAISLLRFAFGHPTLSTCASRGVMPSSHQFLQFLACFALFGKPQATHFPRRGPIQRNSNCREISPGTKLPRKCMSTGCPIFPG